MRGAKEILWNGKKKGVIEYMYHKHRKGDVGGREESAKRGYKKLERRIDEEQ